MPVINGVYLKDFPALPSSVTDANIIPIAISGNQIAYRTTVAGIVTDARVTSKLLTGLSVTGSTILATDTILQAFGKVQNQLNGKVSSVGLTMPAAFNVANSPITSAGTLAVTAAGVASQYIRGDGALADFPTTGGGGSSVSYYLNGSVSQGTIGGNTYYEMNKTPVIGAGTDFTIGADGYIAQFITDANDPASLLIPGGNWNVEMYFSASSSGGTPSFYVEVYKYDGTTFTLLGSSSATPEGITNGTAIDIYYTSVGIPETVLTITDRLAIRVYVTHSGRTITLHTEDNHLSEIITTFSNGLTTLNGLTKQSQYFAVGSTGTDFAIVSSVDTHTFNLPTASATNRGALSSADWSTFNSKAAALSGTINTIAYWDSSTTIASLALATYPSLTELSYVKGVTSAIQTQLNAKQATITLTTTGTSGAATFSANTLNIPQYQASGTYVTSVTGTSPIVSSGGTTPAISIPVATTSVNGYLSSTDWTTFNNKQATITLTTTGTSGAATFSANTLNIPQYADSFVGTVTSVAALTLGTTGTDLSSTVANGTTTPVITLQVPTASATNRGALSSTDWSTFNSKQGTITLTTTGTSGAATFSANTLNIPNYADGGVLSLSAIGATANANAATITGTVLNLQPASASFGGVVTTGTQTFAGAKTLTGALSGTSATFSSTASASAFIPTASSIPTNGMYLSAANTLDFATNSVNRLSITSGGNVGIGVTPNAWFTSGGYKVLQIGAGLSLDSGNDFRARLASNAYVNTSGDWAYANSGFASNYIQTSGTHVWSTAPTGAAGNAITFTERMTITSGGNVGIGTTSPTELLQVGGNAGAMAIGDGLTSNGTSRLKFTSSNSVTNWQISNNDSISGAFEIMPSTAAGGKTFTTPVFSLASTGAATFSSTITTTATGKFGAVNIRVASPTYDLQLVDDSAAKPSTNTWTIASDSRVKENITPYTKGLSAIMAINPVNYDYNGKAGFSIIKGNIGLIAQDVLEILPESVSTYKTKLEESDEEDTELYNFNSHALTYILINAIKELKAEIDLLKGEPIIPTDNNLE